MTSAPLDATRPAVLTLARILVYLSAGLAVLVVLVGLGTGGYGVGGFDVQDGVRSVVLLALQVVLAALLTPGRSWARTVLTLYIVLAMVVAVVRVGDIVLLLSGGAVEVLIALLVSVDNVLLLSALVLMWTKPASRYLNAAR